MNSDQNQEVFHFTSGLALTCFCTVEALCRVVLCCVVCTELCAAQQRSASALSRVRRSTTDCSVYVRHCVRRIDRENARSPYVVAPSMCIYVWVCVMERSAQIVAWHGLVRTRSQRSASRRPSSRNGALALHAFWNCRLERESRVCGSSSTLGLGSAGKLSEGS